MTDEHQIDKLYTSLGIFCDQYHYKIVRFVTACYRQVQYSISGVNIREAVMVNVIQIPKRARNLSRLNIFSRFELAEIPQLLLPGEEVLCMISGFYTAGTATLCVTSHRLLLIDKKFIRLNFEDIRFEAIREVSYSRQLLMASVKLYYAGRELQFRSWYRRELRTLAEFVQSKMFETRDGGSPPFGDRTTSDATTTSQRMYPLTALQSSLTEGRLPLMGRRIYQPIWSARSNRFLRWQRASRFIERLPLLHAAIR